ncbi:MAG: hypothetical protein ACQETR_12460, partial [Thermodesulfobacteriota bacterium]
QELSLTAYVAPHAGAWIETLTTRLGSHFCRGSPPMRGRGLKLVKFKPHAGVRMSPPMRGRGLKLSCLCGRELINKSSPIRGRGLRNARGGGGDAIPLTLIVLFNLQTEDLFTVLMKGRWEKALYRSRYWRP